MREIVLVFGLTGQLACELLRRSQHMGQGWRLVHLGRDQADLSRPEAAAEAIAHFRPRLVINAAAYTAVDQAESQPELTFMVNRDAPAAMAEACAKLGAPFLHVSTDYVFSGQKRCAHTEEDAIAPTGIYGHSKAAGEAAIRERLESHIILRTAWVFGAHGRNFVKTMLRLGATREELRVVDDQWGGPTPAAALAEALLVISKAILNGNVGAWGCFHFCGGPPTTWRRFAEAIFDEAGPRIPRRPTIVPIVTAEFPTPARRPAYSVLDCTRLRQVWGLSQPDWRVGLREVLDELFSSSAHGRLI